MKLKQLNETDSPELWGTKIVRNVSVSSLLEIPALRSLLPKPAIIICPGGALHYIMMEKEGYRIAQWLTSLGFAAFILKYRLVPTPVADDDFITVSQNTADMLRNMEPYTGAAIEDGQRAIQTLRENAAAYHIDPSRIGMIGFSAGGIIASGCAQSESAPLRPNFLSVVYGVSMPCSGITGDSPPLFIAQANDDDLAGDAGLDLCAAWKKAHASVEMHIYARGGHGFGLEKQGLPSDGWTVQFEQWLMSVGALEALPIKK